MSLITTLTPELLHHAGPGQIVARTSELLLVGLGAVLIGLGVLRLSPAGRIPRRLFLAPGVMVSVSSIGLVTTVLCHIPIVQLAPWLWLLWGALAILGLRDIRSAFTDAGDGFGVLCAVSCAAIICIGYIRYGVFDYLGSPALDGWSYVSFAEYLHRYAIETEGHLAPIYQYASHLSHTRYASCALLAALIPPWSTEFDTQMAVGPMLFMVVLSYCLSVLYVARTLCNSGLPGSPLLACLVAALGGWTPLALQSNNFDHLASLFLGPAVCGLALDHNVTKSTKNLLLAFFAAAAVYIYPELAPFTLVALVAGTLDATILRTKRSGLRSTLLAAMRRCVLPLTVAAVLLAPYLRTVATYFAQQFQFSNATSARPGEGIMPALLHPSELPAALWALFPSHRTVLLGVVLSAVALIGLTQFLRQRRLGLTGACVFGGALLAWAIVAKKYDYASYKILLTNDWLLALLVSTGFGVLQAGSASDATFRRRLLPTALAGFFAWTLFIWIHDATDRIAAYAVKDAREFRDLRTRFRAENLPFIVIANDPTVNAWLTYEFRDEQAAFTDFQGYMKLPWVAPLMRRSAMPEAATAEELVTDASAISQEQPLWKTEHVKIFNVRKDPTTPVFTIRPPNGLESRNGSPFFWLGNQDAMISLIGRVPATLNLRLEAFAGPDVVPAAAAPKLTVRIGDAIREISATAAGTKDDLSFALPPGAHDLRFHSDYRGAVLPNSNRDPRVLLIGVSILDLR
jgi:hypothetical protein